MRNTAENGFTTLGPVGGAGGRPFPEQLVPDKSRVSEIVIHCCDYVDGIQLVYKTPSNKKNSFPLVGGEGGERHVFTLKQGEYLLAVSGRAGWYLDCIQFHTNMRSSPVYGGQGGQPFYMKVEKDFEIRGLAGRAECYVDSLGLLAKPRFSMEGKKPKKPAKSKPKAAAKPTSATPAASKATGAKSPPTKTSKAKPKATALPKAPKNGKAVKATVPPDDLLRIKGIGPKSGEALVAAGIDSFAKLANCTQADLREALKKSGATFRAKEAAAWPAQAKALAQERVNSN